MLPEEDSLYIKQKKKDGTDGEVLIDMKIKIMHKRGTFLLIISDY